MSTALVRQALEFVDEEESVGQRGKRRAPRQRQITGQEQQPFKQTRNKKQRSVKRTSSEQSVEENIRKLLALSKPTADPTTAEKIVERAVKGKPLLQKIEVKKEEYKSILFPDEEPFTKFEKEHFCS